MVLSGQWTEEESASKIQDMFDEIQKKYPTERALNIARREHKKQVEQLKQNMTS